MGERLELQRRMAGVVETSWSLGDIDRAIAGPASTTRSPRCTCDRRPRSPLCARSCAGIGKHVRIRACAGPGKCGDLGIVVRGDAE